MKLARTTAIVVLSLATSASATERPHDKIFKTLKSVCAQCHNDQTANGGLNLGKLSWDPADDTNLKRWVRIYDRVSKGEMPPDKKALSKDARRALLNGLSRPLKTADLNMIRRQGRGPLRRLTRVEFEQNLRDLLKLPLLDVRDIVPADRERFQCTRVASVLDVSRVQLRAYLRATDTALRRAVASGLQAPAVQKHRMLATSMFQSATTFGGREAMYYAKDNQMVPLSGGDLSRVRKQGKHDPRIELAIFRSASWPYHGYPDKFSAPRDGLYRVKFSARAVRQVRDFRLRPAHRSVAMTFRARKRSGPDVTGDVRATGGWLDIQPKQATYTTTIYLKRLESFEYSLLGLPVPRPINPVNAPLYYDFPPMPPGGHPGLAYQWLEVSGPLPPENWPPASHVVLFDRLPIRRAKKGRLAVELITAKPRQDAVRLLRRFIKAAERRPTSLELLQACERLVLRQLGQGQPLAEALIAGYAAFLCSTEYLYLREPLPQRDKQLAQFDLANQLSHMLTNSRPSSQLQSVAVAGKLHGKALLQQTRLLVRANTFDRFIHSFSDDWLALKDIHRDQPDIRLYPEYRFDEYLIDSMARETRTFLRAMFRQNLPITALVDTDFVYANDRLARHYDLPPISGSQLRPVRVPKSSPLGGLLTQAAVMKVTANGTTTSPVVRGAWVMDRLLGDPPPPPPNSVPAIAPDLRGATTIRKQLAQHTKDSRCANCHARFDPVGFAMENFDILGAWRDRYRSTERGEQITGIDRAGHRFMYHVAAPIDASGRLNGERFKDVRGLKRILKKDARKLARNLLQRLTVYATGTPVRFADRDVIEQVLDECRGRGYRTGDLLYALVRSRIFTGEIQR